ncbi:MAG: ATP-dependent DNA helicase RecG [Candidatus Yanofskybacteria bacterium RIFCSPLOWO2_01_FULL_49_17]|uniref:ATP-dependent DNA helicase RecG n=1 Tax=Candidatus Yanofskybacteria bacterium RIFCSPLOWO2_01_FULL_49_17 TaxID=1802700 RepID=A0A1F8GPV0_9BACT|nr:MAG: ATP-dependent DNA helicase RecG [Candidatus Yanofskybacteria bacterium RIFCSPLOWO2_01_FULL_49_17]
MDLELPIEKLSHVGTRNLPRLKRLGISTVRDLLWHLPARYEDFSAMTAIADVQPDEKVHIQGEVVKIDTKRIFPRRMSVTTAIVKDDSGAIKAVWFNQPYIENALAEGTRVSLAGTAKLSKHGLQLSSPTYEKLRNGEYGPVVPAGGLTHTEGLVPVYPETEGISSKYLRFLIKPILEQIKISDHLPDEVLDRNGLVNLEQAIHAVHYPKTPNEAEKAKERLAFDDLLLFQIKALLERRKMNQLKSVPIVFDKELVTDFISRLPFELTKDQKVAAWEILKDLEKSYPMNRLMEGDVGSGKTVVALIAAIQAAKTARPDGGRGYQTVFMAPTEVLANQHMETIRGLISHTDIEVALLTAANAWTTYSLGKKADIKKRIASGQAKIIIGTHALIQKGVTFPKLALVVIDEQHRFGVKQRAHLVKNKDIVPHLLSMTATPIPRTLALTIYGDLDISIIKERPVGRQKIITRIVSTKDRAEAYQFIRSEIKRGRQVFVICPRIETSEAKVVDAALPRRARQGTSAQMKLIWADVKAVEEEYKKLSELIFPDLKVAMLHGKMKPKEKQKAMSDFKSGKHDVLVSTSVIEVGVDMPNATVMMIENADRFGLAQLHQFRGRIGRGEHQSYCLLFATADTKTVNQRLKALVDSDDGFLLAEKDMAIRGPGEFFGTGQSGLPDLAMAALSNVELIKKARTEARILLKNDANLTNYPLLRERLDKFQKLTHFE